MAIPFSVCLQSQLPSFQFGCVQLLRNVVACSEVHFIESLALERGVWLAVVLIDVERDQLPYAGCGIQRVQEQPLVLDHAPPRLNQ